MGTEGGSVGRFTTTAASPVDMSQQGTKGCRIWGMSIKATGSVPATLDIYDGSATGKFLCSMSVTVASASDTEFVPGVLAPNGLYLVWTNLVNYQVFIT